MIKWFRQLDGILRGDATRVSSLRGGEIRTPVAGLCTAIVLLGVAYGLCMGSFAMIRTGGQAYQQLLASAAKVPLLFALTLAVTFPSLYVFNSLVGSRLSVVSAGRLLVASVGVMLAVLASLGPIVLFFAISTTSYPFMVVLNVVASAVAGVLGLMFLLRTLDRLVTVKEAMIWHRREPAPAAAPEGHAGDHQDPPGDDANAPDGDRDEPATEAESEPRPPETAIGALDRVSEYTPDKAKAVFRIWIVVFALVGAQMSWVLRPFIGDPDMPFTLFRQRTSNFFIAVFRAVANLLS